MFSLQITIVIKHNLSFLSKCCLIAKKLSNFFHAGFLKKVKVWQEIAETLSISSSSLMFIVVHLKFEIFINKNHGTMVFRIVLLQEKTIKFTFSFKFIKISSPITQFAFWHALNVPWHIFVSRKFTENYKRMKKRSCNHAQRNYVSYCYYHYLDVLTLFAIRKLCILFLTIVVRRFSRYYLTE